MSRLISAFSPGQADGGTAQRDLLGGKGAGLSELSRAGYPVPPGFILTTACCAHYHAHGHTLPPGLEDDIRHHLASLENYTGRRFIPAPSAPPAPPLLLSVRSGAAVSMPGMMDTVLNVGAHSTDPWADLLAAIRAVFASWHSERAIAYRAHHRLTGLAGTAVTIQVMVPSEVSGVAFTADPNTGDPDRLVIEASWGLGEAVVSGAVTPDSLVVARATGAVLSCSLGSPERGPCLAPRHLAALRDLILRVESHFSTPQDIEWAVADNRLWLLQTRSIKNLSTLAAQRNATLAIRATVAQAQNSGHPGFARHNLSETLPHPTPLTWSLIRPFMSGSGGFGSLYRQIGFTPGPAVEHTGFLTLIGGRIYQDLALAPEMFGTGHPYRYDLARLRRDPAAAQLPPSLATGSLLTRFRVNRRLTAVGRTLDRLAETHDRELADQHIPAFTTWARAALARAATLHAHAATFTPAEFVALWQEAEHHVFHDFAPASLLPTLIGAHLLAALQSQLAETRPDEDPAALALQLALGGETNRTLAANEALRAVAQNRLSLTDWLREHGHRAAAEMELATPRWHEDPAALTPLLTLLRDAPAPAAPHAQHPALDHPATARLVALARRHLHFREEGKYHLMRGYEVFRRLALAAASRLQLSGDDVFFLTRDELFAALATGYAPAALLAERRLAHQAEEKLSLPDFIDPATDPLAPAAANPADGVFTGTGITTGRLTAPVRHLASPAEAAKLQPGDILVCATTDPAWTPLFQRAGGLVIERGGLLSHGALVAREMQLPALVLPDALRLLPDGQPHTLDATAGLISRADLAPTTTAPAPAALPLPPPPSARDRACARLRNRCLLLWTVVLAAAFLLPPAYLLHPLYTSLDTLLWPVLSTLGGPTFVATVAATLALLYLGGQRLLTDHARLRLAVDRRQAILRALRQLPPDSAEAARLRAGIATVPARVLTAGLVIPAILLGPVCLLFFWLPLRLDPAANRAEPNTTVQVSALIDSSFRGPITLHVPPPLQLDELTPATQSLPPIRETLEKLRREWRTAPDTTALPWTVAAAARQAHAATLTDLNAYLAAGVPPQPLLWSVRVPANATDGRHLLALSADGHAPLPLSIVTGSTPPPANTTIASGPTVLQSLVAIYPPPARREPFLRPFTRLGYDTEIGWLTWFIALFLPLNLALKRLFRIP